MKRLLLVILSSMFLVNSAFAMGSVRNPNAVFPNDKLIADNPAWTGAKYSGQMFTFSSTNLGVNINYADKVTVQKGLVTSRLIGDTAFKIQPSAVVIINSSNYGQMAYNEALAKFRNWVKPNPISYGSDPVVFQDSGMIIDNTYIMDMSFAGEALRDQAGNWSRGQVTIRLSMPLSTYNNVFEPAFFAWGKMTATSPGKAVKEGGLDLIITQYSK